jgi:MFS family permease
MTLAQFVVGRFILGVGIQIMVVSAPAYAVEIAPPHWRGRAVGEYPRPLEYVKNMRSNFV